MRPLAAEGRSPDAAAAQYPAGESQSRCAGMIRPLQSGDVNLYLLYVFAVILLAYLLGAV